MVSSHGSISHSKLHTQVTSRTGVAMAVEVPLRLGFALKGRMPRLSMSWTTQPSRCSSGMIHGCACGDLSELVLHMESDAFKTEPVGNGATRTGLVSERAVAALVRIVVLLRIRPFLPVCLRCYCLGHLWRETTTWRQGSRQPSRSTGGGGK